MTAQGSTSANADQFVGAQIERDPAVFDASKYSFFDLPQTGGLELEGALEDAPAPEEEGLLGGLEDEIDPDILRDKDDEDYTLAGMFGGGNRRGDEELDAQMARSLPRNMFEDDDSPSLQRRAQQQQQQLPTRGIFQHAPVGSAPPSAIGTPPPPLAHHHQHAHSMPAVPESSQGTPGRPLTLAELEAQMQAQQQQRQQLQGGPVGTPGGSIFGGMQPPGYPIHPGMPNGSMMGTPAPGHMPPHMQQQDPRFGPPPFGHPAHGMPPPHVMMQPPPQGPPHGMPQPQHMGTPPPQGQGRQPMILSPQGLPMPAFNVPQPPPHTPPHIGQQFGGQQHQQGPPPQQPPPHMGHMQHHPQGGPHPPHPPLHPHGGLHPGQMMPPSTPPPASMAQGQNMMPRASPAPFRTPQIDGPGHRHGVYQQPSFQPPAGMQPFVPMGPGSGNMMMRPPGMPGMPGVPLMPGMMMMQAPAGAGRRIFQGKLMTADEVDNILHIMWSSVHTKPPYAEDYFYQAVLNQRTRGANAPFFRPEVLRSLRADVVRLDPSFLVRFAAVEGLGKIVLSNIRTPKVLMDLTSAPVEASNATSTSADGDMPATTSRPLDQEPVLAARIMVEDCHDKLLDIDDIDRCFTAAMAANQLNSLPEEPRALHTRRKLLTTSVVNAFDLPATPAAPVDGADGGTAAVSSADGVFMNIMSLTKGRNMFGRVLRVLLARPPPPTFSAQSSANGAAPGLDAADFSKHTDPDRLIWASLRNFQVIWGTSISDPDIKSTQLTPLIEASHRLASALKEAVQQLKTQERAVAAVTALASVLKQRLAVTTQPNASPMDSILPLAQVRNLSQAVSDTCPADWFGDVLATLLQRGAQVILDEDDSAAAAAWKDGVSSIVQTYCRHVSALRILHQEMTRQATAKGGSPAPEAMEAVRSLACRPLALILLGHTQDPQVAEQLRSQLRALL